MRTTIDIPDQIMHRLKAHVEQSGLSIKEVVSQAISLYFSQKAEVKKTQFTLSDGSVDGEGLSSDFQGKGWESIRDAVYEQSSFSKIK